MTAMFMISYMLHALERMREMKFVVSDEVFERLESVCFGVILAKGINNSIPNAEVAALLETSIHFIEEKMTANSSLPGCLYKTGVKS